MTACLDRNQQWFASRGGNAVSSVTDLHLGVEVAVGVDTHVHTHTAAIVDAVTGGRLATIEVPATEAGYTELVDFVADRVEGRTRMWAIEGTASHGANLTRYLHADGHYVVEMDRPQRAPRRHGAKTDAIDAVRAAREALARERNNLPKVDGHRHAVATLLTVRRSAVKAASNARRQLHGLIVSAPEQVQRRFDDHTPLQRVKTAARLRIRKDTPMESAITIQVLRNLARRISDLHAEIDSYDKQITDVLTDWCPQLLDEPGIGPITGAVILSAYSHPGRIHSEGGFAMLAGTAPIPACQRRVKSDPFSTSEN
ncbi:transposase [Gordonia hydrophobica]|uniref:Transposase n=1 Tax=Gordonia hydrophobica TaxID=40516 RepID=A0ABZ2TZ32_9ACTN